jgi:hypothetical protein
MKKIFIFVLIILVNFNSVLAKDYVSKNPNYLKRGLVKKVTITKLKNKEAYQIIKDPTGVSPIELIEVFSPKKVTVLIQNIGVIEVEVSLIVIVVDKEWRYLKVVKRELRNQV